MQTISNALSAKGANGYYREDYQSDESFSDSLTKILRDKDNADKNLPLDEEDGGEGKLFGEWSGTLAEELGLSGTVKQKEFHKLTAGRHPITGEQLIRRVMPRRKEDRFGRVKMTNEHRAGWDLTFSTPKSVSLAALVGGDARIIEAHRKAVDKALKETAEFVEARMGNTKPSVRTGKYAAAVFLHDMARPDVKTGYAAPDLHSHCFLFNLTKTADGKYRAIQPYELFAGQKFSRAIYWSELAKELKELGYEIQIDKKTGAPEINGISRAYIEASSPRQQEIKETARSLGVSSTKKVAHLNRRNKNFDRGAMLLRQAEMEAKFGGQAEAAVQKAKTNQNQNQNQNLDSSSLIQKEKVAESVSFAVSEAEVKPDETNRRTLITSALQYRMGEITFDEVTAELEIRREKGELDAFDLEKRITRKRPAEKAEPVELKETFGKKESPENFTKREESQLTKTVLNLKEKEPESNLQAAAGFEKINIKEDKEETNKYDEITGGENARATPESAKAAEANREFGQSDSARIEYEFSEPSKSEFGNGQKSISKSGDYQQPKIGTSRSEYLEIDADDRRAEFSEQSSSEQSSVESGGQSGNDPDFVETGKLADRRKGDRDYSSKRTNINTEIQSGSRREIFGTESNTQPARRRAITNENKISFDRADDEAGIAENKSKDRSGGERYRFERQIACIESSETEQTDSPVGITAGKTEKIITVAAITETIIAPTDGTEIFKSGGSRNAAESNPLHDDIELYGNADLPSGKTNNSEKSRQIEFFEGNDQAGDDSSALDGNIELPADDTARNGDISSIGTDPNFYQTDTSLRNSDRRDFIDGYGFYSGDFSAVDKGSDNSGNNSNVHNDIRLYENEQVVISTGGAGSVQPGRGDALVLGKADEFGTDADAVSAGSNIDAVEREQSTSAADSVSLAEEVRQIFERQETQERLAREIVEQANLQRLQQSREEINEQVQKQMFAYLLQTAEIQPQPALVERIEQIIDSNALPNELASSQNENVQFSSALEASHWLLVQNDSSTGRDVLAEFAEKVEKEHKSAEIAERKEESVKRFEIPPDEMEDFCDNPEMDYEYSMQL